MSSCKFYANSIFYFWFRSFLLKIQKFVGASASEQAIWAQKLWTRVYGYSFKLIWKPKERANFTKFVDRNTAIFIDDHAKDGGEESFTKMHCVMLINMSATLQGLDQRTQASCQKVPCCHFQHYGLLQLFKAIVCRKRFYGLAKNKLSCKAYVREFFMLTYG